MAITKDTLEERINKTMVGRAVQLDAFKKQFDRVLEGGMGLSLISGQPGVGKSFFVEHAAASLTGAAATYVHGKFRQYDGSPLIAFSEIIEQTVRHILTLPAEALKNVRNDLNQKLGADARLILSACPYAQILFEAHKPVRTDNLEQLKYRVRKAVYQFLTAASTALFPLIIFIDDLQWADALSISIIETLCQDYEYLNLHLVLAWREDDTGKVFLNPAKLPEGDDIRISLGGLAYEDIDQYTRLVFEQDIEYKDYFIRMLYGLTLGSPFNISRVLRLFLQENVLEYSAASEKWLVRRDKMEKLNLPADIEQLLTRQIDALTKVDKELLHLIACCGGAAAPLLQVLTGEDEGILNGRLEGLCKDALLVKTVSDGAASYGFTHDIVLKIVYNRLTDGEKSEIHFSVAKALRKRKSRPFSIAPHLLAGFPSLLSQGDAEKWIDILFEAGVIAKHGAAVEQALELFERCAELLSGDRPQGKDDFDLSVRLELAECRYICRRAEKAKKDFEALLAKYPETENQIRIKKKYITLFAVSGEFEKVLDLGNQILVHLNFSLNPKDIIPDLIKSRLILSGRKISRLENAPEICDQRLLLIMETMSNMLPAANRISGETASAIAVKLALLSEKYGNSDYAPIAYASYTYVLFHILKDYKRGERLEDVTLLLIDKCENAASKFVSMCILGSLTHHWSHPLRDTAAYLEQTVLEGVKEGSSLYGGHSSLSKVGCRPHRRVDCREYGPVRRDGVYLGSVRPVGRRRIA